MMRSTAANKAQYTDGMAQQLCSGYRNALAKAWVCPPDIAPSPSPPSTRLPQRNERLPPSLCGTPSVEPQSAEAMPVGSEPGKAPSPPFVDPGTPAPHPPKPDQTTCVGCTRLGSCSEKLACKAQPPSSTDVPWAHYSGTPQRCFGPVRGGGGGWRRRGRIPRRQGRLSRHFISPVWDATGVLLARRDVLCHVTSN